MTMLHGLAVLLLCQSPGKAAARPIRLGPGLPLPGPVLGMLAAALAVITGLVGTLSSPWRFDRAGIAGAGLRGFVLGTTSHGIGAAQALPLHADDGAPAGLAPGLQVVLASLLMPMLAPRLTRWLGG